VFPASDGVTGEPEQCQDRAYHDQDDADRPDNGGFGDESDDEENYSDFRHEVAVLGR
jgi:hypothetical protein